MSGYVTRKFNLILFIFKNISDSNIVKRGAKTLMTLVSSIVTRKNNSWMFWGSFAGIERGPCVFWEREWGNITSEEYSEHILPRISKWIREKREETGQDYIFMHDNASVHKGRPAREVLDANGVESMPWPANSPDSNPIENVWSMMKYYI
ncbi:hypothetical protein K3495_g6743 [Podosphaera aphanis]|nr:hypothetical protein K3495_g6743 [Podosphaera aphanis]